MRAVCGKCKKELARFEIEDGVLVFQKNKWPTIWRRDLRVESWLSWGTLVVQP